MQKCFDVKPLYLDSKSELCTCTYINDIHVTFTGMTAGPRKEFWSCFSQDILKNDHHLFKMSDMSCYTYVNLCSQIVYVYSWLFCYRLVPHHILKHEKHHQCSIDNIEEDHLDLLKFIGKMLAVAVNHKDVISFRLVQPIIKMVSKIILYVLPRVHNEEESI